MQITLEEFLQKISSAPHEVEFADTIAVIDSNYVFTPVPFTNGSIHNEAGQNIGSCKIFAFAQRHQLNDTQTLGCFGHYYRDEVLGQPDSDNHANIRSFIKNGWAGIKFAASPLQ